MVYHLTERQLEVIWAVAEYGGNEAAADKLGLRLQTIKNHLSRILYRTKSKSTLQAYHRIIAGRRLRVTTTSTYEEIE